MRNKELKSLKNNGLSKCLIVISIVVLSTSCEKEDGNKVIQSFSFHDYLFIGNVECYDSIGNKLDSLSYIYSQDDFIFTDEFEFPYEKIEINTDSTVVLYYEVDDEIEITDGKVSRENDTLYFYTGELHFKEILFKALIVDNQLQLPGYGYIYYTFLSNGFLHIENDTKHTKLGIPDLKTLIDNYPSPTLNGQGPNIQCMYIQRFDLIYDEKY